MTNSRKQDRTVCVCEHYPEEWRDTPEPHSVAEDATPDSETWDELSQLGCEGMGAALGKVGRINLRS